MALGDGTHEDFLRTGGDDMALGVANGSTDHRAMPGDGNHLLCVEMPFVEAGGTVEPDGMVQAQRRK